MSMAALSDAARPVVINLSVSWAAHDLTWDLFVGSVPGSHFEQTSGWGAVRNHYGWQVMRIVASEGATIVGGLQALIRPIGRIATIGYVSRGPLVATGRADVANRLVSELERIARKSRWLYCVFDYPYDSHSLAIDMASRGYFSHPAGIPPSGLLAATVLLDLQPDEETILSRMNGSVRRNVRRSQKKGLTFELGGSNDIERFRILMLATCVRRGAAPTPPQKDYFQKLWTELNPSGSVRLFLVRYEDELVCAAFAFTVSDTIRIWKVGWSGTHQDKDPNHFMRWEIIRWAKANGFRTLDFVWIDTEDAKRAARGELTPEGFRDGTTYFKLGFGGTIYFPPPVQSKFYNPLVRLGYRCGGGRLLASRLFQRAVSRYWSRASG